MTRKTSISQWKYVVDHLEGIVENQQKTLSHLNSTFNRAWLEGFERGLAEAKENLEIARSQSFFLVLVKVVPQAETGGQLLNRLTDSIIEEIDAYMEAIAEQDITEAPAAEAEEDAEEVSTEFEEETEEDEAELVAAGASYGMMDGIKQWIATDPIIQKSVKIMDSLKIWREA